jgi:hypothetical protein
MLSQTGQRSTFAASAALPACGVSVKLLVLTPFTASLNTAETLAASCTSVAPDAGVLLVTVGGVVSTGGAPALKIRLSTEMVAFRLLTFIRISAAGRVVGDVQAQLGRTDRCTRRQPADGEAQEGLLGARCDSIMIYIFRNYAS